MNIICINNLLPSDFQPFLGGKAIVTAQSMLREPIKMLKPQMPFFNTEIILISSILKSFSL